jgi:hypothetical protein
MAITLLVRNRVNYKKRGRMAHVEPKKGVMFFVLSFNPASSALLCWVTHTRSLPAGTASRQRSPQAGLVGQQACTIPIIKHAKPQKYGGYRGRYSLPRVILLSQRFVSDLLVQAGVLRTGYHLPNLEYTKPISTGRPV